MLGLPSTTEVNRRLPKEAFYRNLDLKPVVKRQFVEDIERITVRNSLKPTTMNVTDGERVHEIMLVEVELRRRVLPKAALCAIAAANANRLVFACKFDDEVCLAVMLSQFMAGPWLPAKDVHAQADPADMDSLWDSLASQVVYGDAGCAGETVEERARHDAKAGAIRAEIVKLEGLLRRERQHARKNELFAKIKVLKLQLTECEKGR